MGILPNRVDLLKDPTEHNGTEATLPNFVDMFRNSANSNDSVEIFIKFLEDIFAKPRSEIIELCDEFEIEALMELRSRLFKILGEIIPTLQERELCHRKKHKLMAEDIYIIGNSLVSTMEDKRLKKLLKPSNIKMNESLDQSEMNTICIDVEQDKNESNLLQICVELKVSVQELVGKVNTGYKPRICTQLNLYLVITKCNAS